jgi:hypothetical protein
MDEQANPAAAGWRKEIDLPSERGSSRLILDELLEQLGAHGWSPSEIFAIQLACEEAITNAIVHGNQLDTAKRVRRDADAFLHDVRGVQRAWQPCDDGKKTRSGGRLTVSLSGVRYATLNDRDPR